MLTYPIIASEILNRLFSGSMRSSDLTKDLGYSAKLIYQTLNEMQKDKLIDIQTDRPKFKVYQITDKGKTIAIDSKIKSQSGILEQIKKSPELEEIFAGIYNLISEKNTSPVLFRNKMLALEPLQIPLLDWEVLLSTAAAAYSKSVKRLEDSIDNEPSHTLAPMLTIESKAT